MNGAGRTLTSVRLAADKEWEELARVLLEDLEDLQLGGQWVRAVLGIGSGGREEMKRAIRVCVRRTYFNHLAFKERDCCKSVMGKFRRSLGSGRGKKKGKPSSTGRKTEWCLSQEERGSMDGEVELIKEMHERHRLNGVGEATVSQEMFSID